LNFCEILVTLEKRLRIVRPPPNLKVVEERKKINQARNIIN